MRANASSVDSDLGGGDHGYLGLVLTEEEYERVAPGNPFIAPRFPGRLEIPRGTDTIDAMNMREEHKRELNLYRECREVEKALLRHITTAVEPKFIDFLKNEDTDLIEDDIPTVLAYLFSNHGKVPTSVVKEKEQEVLATPFVPSDHMVTIYRPIEQLKTLAEIAGIPYTETQIVDFGVQLIKKTKISKQPSESGIRKLMTKNLGKFSKNISRTHSRHSKTYDGLPWHKRDTNMPTIWRQRSGQN